MNNPGGEAGHCFICPEVSKCQGVLPSTFEVAFDGNILSSVPSLPDFNRFFSHSLSAFGTEGNKFGLMNLIYRTPYVALGKSFLVPLHM